MRTHFATLLAALGRQTGQDFVPDSGGACGLVFDDLPVTLQYLEADQCILLYCTVGAVPDGDAERLAFYSRLLRANFFFRETAGATLAADESTKLVALQQAFPLQALDETGFLSLLERYLNMAEHWRRACASLSSLDGSGRSSGFEGDPRATPGAQFA